MLPLGSKEDYLAFSSAVISTIEFGYICLNSLELKMKVFETKYKFFLATKGGNSRFPFQIKSKTLSNQVSCSEPIKCLKYLSSFIILAQSIMVLGF